MASYEDVLQNPGTAVEVTTEDVLQSFQESDAVVSQETLKAIDAILTDSVADGASAVVMGYAPDMTAAQVQEAGVTQLVVNDATLGSDFGSVASAVPIVTLGDGVQNQVVDITADATTQVITVGAGGGNTISVADASTTNMTVQLGGGIDDTVSTARGNDSISFAGGSATIDTGAGDDTVVIGEAGQVRITSGGNSLTVRLDDPTVAVKAEVIGTGDGMDQVFTTAKPNTYELGFEGGQFFMRLPEANAATRADDGLEIKMTDVNVVSYDVAGTDGELDPGDAISVLARDAHQSLVARLYQIGLGRQAIDNAADYDPNVGALGGLDFWYGQEYNGNELAVRLLDVTEFHDKTDHLTNWQYVDYLFSHANNEEVLDGMTKADFVAKLEERADDPNARFDIAWWIAKSEDVTEILGNDGDKYVIDGGDFNAEFNA